MTTTTEKVWTVNAIKDAMRAAGSHWFDPDTMRFFGTRVLGMVYQGEGGVFFVTSEKPPHGPRGYTVRKFDPTESDIDTVGEVCGYKTGGAASTAARKLAGKAAGTTHEQFQPVSVLAQFAHDLQKHTNPERGTETETVDAARHLIRLAGRHHKMMEAHCNGGAELYDAEGEPLPALENLRGHIKTRAKAVGCSGVIFSGDPRGCTVKLTFADGYTNDFGKEGYCVPTSEKAE